jgi:bidirectional [NiFe] hydrogenase diaphorase subunit
MTIEELEQIAKNVQQENAKYDFEVNVCMDLACASQGAGALKDALEKAAEAAGKKVLVRRTGCMGPCSHGPLVRVDPEETLYHHVKAENAPSIVYGLGGSPVPELQCDLNDHFASQVRVVLENAGLIDPEKVDDYIAHDGYKALLTVLTRDDPQRRGSSHHGKRAARARRRRISYRAEVGHRGQGQRRREICGLQRGRRRPRRVHGSQRDGR